MINFDGNEKTSGPQVFPAKTAVPIEMPSGLRTWLGPRDHVLDGVQIPHGKGQVLLCKSVNQARRGWSSMPGHVRQNDTDFTLQEELNAPIFRPLSPNFAFGPL